jgi:hypothetical protein
VKQPKRIAKKTRRYRRVTWYLLAIVLYVIMYNAIVNVQNVMK